MNTETAPVDQAQPQSMEDRVAAQFGVTDDEAPSPQPEGDDSPLEDEAATPEPEEVDVEWNGTAYRVDKNLSEAVSKASDYTRKTQEVADERRRVDYERQATEAARQEIEFARTVQGELTQLQGMDNYLTQLNQVNVDDLPFEEGIAHDRKVARLERQRATLKQSIDQKHAEFGDKQKQTFETLRTQARDLLSKQFGGLDQKAIDDLTAHAKTFGYSDRDIEMISLDPRAQSMLYKAWKYDQLQANKAAAVQKATGPALKPGSSNPMPASVKERFAYKKALASAKTPEERAAAIQKRVESLF